MREVSINIPVKNIRNTDSRRKLLFSGVVLWCLGLLFLFIAFGLEDLNKTLGKYYLIPWAFLTGIVVLSPSAYLIYKKEFDPFHPLVYAAWSYIFPAFVLGAVILSFGWSNPYFLVFIEEPEYNLPLSLFYVAIGYIGLTIGFYLPVCRYAARRLEARFANVDWKPTEIWIPGILLILAGAGLNLLGFLQGVLGFQKTTEIGSFDALLSFFLILLSAGYLLLWLAIFQNKRRTPIFFLILILLIALIPLRMALMGSRSSLILSIIPIVMAFLYSGYKLKAIQVFVIGILFAVSLFIGIVYGTTFRNIKGSEERIGTSDYVGQISATIDYLSTADTGMLFAQGMESLAERVENLSSLAVVVANYEKLAPYEESYNLENNIINDSKYFFIPRFLWSEKPPSSDTRAYSALYFNYEDNSFAITPFGDLLRNFGPLGIVFGMMLLGVYLGIIYRFLIDRDKPKVWKTVAYFSLLTVVSYESFYATIFPSVLRVAFVIVISFFVLNIIIKLLRTIKH